MKIHNFLAKQLLLVLILFSFHSLQAQYKIYNLDKRQGFKKIILGEKIQKYLGYFEFSQKGSKDYDIYSLKDSLAPKHPYENIGYMEIVNLELLVYRSRILEIRVGMHLEDFESIKDILVAAYGEPNAPTDSEEPSCFLIENDFGMRTDCSWLGKRVALWCSKIDYESRKKTQLAFQDLYWMEDKRVRQKKEALEDL